MFDFVINIKPSCKNQDAKGRVEVLMEKLKVKVRGARRLIFLHLSFLNLDAMKYVRWDPSTKRSKTIFSSMLTDPICMALN